MSVTGCFPMHFVARPGISGTVVDEATSVPIANASVTLEMQAVQGRMPASTTTTTDATGAFLIAPKRRWGIYVVPMDFMGLVGTAHFRAPGYIEGACEVRTHPAGLAILRLGEVRLEPTS
jgi:hypothetical protein